MQTMTGADGDTHDHGPPNTSTLHQATAYPRLAVWTTKLSPSAINSLCGATAGMASGIVTCPLDVIKTKLQAQGSFANQRLNKGPGASAMYHGMLGTARTIIRQDGFKGMYRGLGPMLLGYLPTWAVYMTVYDSGREFFGQHGYDKDSGRQWVGRVYAALAAGACSTLATNPIWVIKTRLMSQVSRKALDGARTPWHYTSTFDAARKMYAAEGVKAFYSGLTPALLGLTHVAIQFPLYEYFKTKFTGLEMGEAPTEDGQWLKNLVGSGLATVLSKICATSATYPHEVLRTRLQTQERHAHPEHNHNGVANQPPSPASPASKPIANTDGQAYRPKYQGVFRTCKIILQEEGWRAFYSGMGTNMIRAVPAAMTTMLTFESLKIAVTRMQEEGKEIKESGRLAA